MEVKPLRGFYFSEDHIRHARRNMELFPWALNTYRKWKEQCDRFLEELAEEQLYDCVLGMRGEAFAYGISGCPSCGSAFPMEPEKQHGMFSAIGELPAKKLTCPSCRTVMPNDSFPDEGHGLEIGPKAYYLIGMWNFYYGGELLGGVRNHEGLATKLTYLYMLTGDVRYARRAIIILDAFAAVNPGSIGPRDFTAFGGSFEIGRLHMLTSIVHRIKVLLAQDYDWLGGLNDLLDVPSPALERLGSSGTIRENIVAMLNDYMLTEPGGPYYDLKNGNLTNLQNHESDGVRAMLAVGLALGREEYCKWGREAVEAYFYNAIGRDGMYYEGSYGYSLFTGTVFLDVAILALRASTKEQLEVFHPFGCDRFFRFAVENPLEMMCQGHLPSYGDWGRDSSVGTSADLGLLSEAYRAALYFYQFAPSDDLREKARECMIKLYPTVKDRLGNKGVDLFFRHPHEAASLPKGIYRLSKYNTAMGQAGIGILRGTDDATVLMRLGPNLTHAHDDTLAYQFYDCGKEISADIGYGIFGTNAHFGWATKTIAHNTVTVNLDSVLAAGQLFKPFAGGEFTFILQGDRVRAMEGRAPALYGIEDYRRMLAIASLEGGRSYTIDFFHVAGADTADYSFHAFHEASVLRFEGAKPVKNGNHWTLAGVDSERKPYYDAPGLSFGERVTAGETFGKLLDDEEPRLWTTEPNNGYGFIFDVKEFAPQDLFVEARWTAESGTEMTWIGLCDETDRFFTGLCPSLDGAARHPILVQRSRQETKTYAAVSYASTSGASEEAKRVRRVSTVEADGRLVTAIKVELVDGCTDYWVYSPIRQTIIVHVRDQAWEIVGRSAWLRLDSNGEFRDGSCLSAESMRYGKSEKTGSSGRWTEIVQVDGDEPAVWIRGDEEPVDTGSRFARVRSFGGDRSSLYPVGHISREGELLKVQLRDSIVLSKGVVCRTDDDMLLTSYPLPLGAETTNGIESPFRGKWVKGQRGGLAVIIAIPELKRIKVRITAPFENGEPFDILDIQPGCEFAFV